jgi:hypothetical protein
LKITKFFDELKIIFNITLITKGQTGVVTGYDSDNDVIVLYPSGKKWVY